MSRGLFRQNTRQKIVHFVSVFESNSKLRLIDCEEFEDCSLLKSICLPASVENLRIYSFSSCVSLTTVTFERNSRLVEIHRLTFFECSSLKSICIPASLEILNADGFQDCTSLRTVTFEPNSKPSLIEYWPFSGCASLKSICTPASFPMKPVRYPCPLPSSECFGCFVYYCEDSLRRLRSILEDDSDDVSYCCIII
jgi:hypothetical protein